MIWEHNTTKTFHLISLGLGYARLVITAISSNLTSAMGRSIGVHLLPVISLNGGQALRLFPWASLHKSLLWLWRATVLNFVALLVTLLPSIFDRNFPLWRDSIPLPKSESLMARKRFSVSISKPSFVEIRLELVIYAAQRMTDRQTCQHNVQTKTWQVTTKLDIFCVDSVVL